MMCSGCVYEPIEHVKHVGLRAPPLIPYKCGELVTPPRRRKVPRSCACDPGLLQDTRDGMRLVAISSPRTDAAQLAFEIGSGRI
eukprot:365048-Chlamydomonas_euryale.AAC.16